MLLLYAKIEILAKIIIVQSLAAHQIVNALMIGKSVQMDSVLINAQLYCVWIVNLEYANICQIHLLNANTQRGLFIAEVAWIRRMHAMAFNVLMIVIGMLALLIKNVCRDLHAFLNERENDSSKI